MLGIPVFRKLAKSVIQHWYGCKWFKVTRYPIPKPGHLQRDRSDQVSPFEIVGNDYTGQLHYSFKGKKDLKAYILLFSCTVSTGVHLELVSNLSTTEFVKSFKKLISRRGNPNIIYSDNRETLMAPL